MQRKLTILLAIAFLFELSSCIKKPKEESSGVVIATLAVDLDADETHIRTQESLIGNFIADALKSGLENKGEPVDFVLINAGAIRFDQSIRPDGIYKKGLFTSDMIDEMLPFGENKISAVFVTGLQLKEIIERSLAQLPLDKGAFMQLSKELKITVDITKQAQVIDETVSPVVIQTPGERLISVQFNETPIEDSQIYRVGVSDYIANGNDGYATFSTIAASEKIVLDLSLTNLVREQVIIDKTISPVIEGRINF